METSTTTAYLVATGIVVGAGLLLIVLRHLRVGYRYLWWTVALHIVFVGALSIAVFSAPMEPSRLRSETIQVVMLPPLPEPDEEEEPIVVPPEPEETPPVEQTRPKPTPELPKLSQTTSVASRFIGGPTSASSLPSSRRSTRQNLSPFETAASGVPTNRADLGVLSGDRLDLDPSSAPRLPSESSQTAARRTASDRPTRGSPNAAARRDAPRGPASGATGAVALPKGFSLTGDVQGRALRYVPDAPTASAVTGADVVIRFWVAPNGSVKTIQFVRKAGDPNLERAARNWVERIQFAPLPANVEPIDQWGEVTVAFRKDLK